MTQSIAAARAARKSATGRIRVISDELSRLVAASQVYVPGETVHLWHPTGNIEALVLGRSEKEAEYRILLVDEGRETTMEARYFIDSSDVSVAAVEADGDAGAATAGAV